jgi:hypothetical protein
VRTFDYAAEWDTRAFPSSDAARELEDHRFNFLYANHFEALRQMGLRKGWILSLISWNDVMKTFCETRAGKVFRKFTFPEKAQI